MRVYLLPAYSKLADEALQRAALGEDALPAGLQLAEHQAYTLLALRDPEVDVVINTALTGDGKSLAAYLDTLLAGRRGYYEQKPALALYPTIELSRDQERQFAHYTRLFGVPIRS